MQDKVYIHYGHDHFDEALFEPIRNMRPIFVKPHGGLWASPINTDWGWKDWCHEEEYRYCTEDNSFKFTLPDANILYISSVKDLLAIQFRETRYDQIFLNFEELVRQGCDAIELNISADRDLYWKLYGWDCDSILVMNPSKIHIITQVTTTDDILV